MVTSPDYFVYKHSTDAKLSRRRGRTERDCSTVLQGCSSFALEVARDRSESDNIFFSENRARRREKLMKFLTDDFNSLGRLLASLQADHSLRTHHSCNSFKSSNDDQSSRGLYRVWRFRSCFGWRWRRCRRYGRITSRIRGGYNFSDKVIVPQGCWIFRNAL